MKIETLAIHAGHKPDPSTGALVPPISLSTTFERAADGSYPHGYLYARNGNPNRAMLEEVLAVLENGKACAVFSSGSAAMMAIFQMLGPGQHLLLPEDVYSGTVRLVRELFVPWKLEFDQVDMTNLDAVKAAMRPNTRMIWVETPSNPLLKISDIAALARIAHEAGAICVCDNTWATPVLQQPLTLGADLVVHATTKYLNGHGDVLGGAVVARKDDEQFARLRTIQVAGGAVAAPFDCWLTLRGLRTLPIRMRAHCENAAKVAEFLHQHARVEAVYYPGLSEHPGHSLAMRQMDAGGGMLSFQVKGKSEEAIAVAAKVKVWTRATSLGGTESLIEHRASIEGPGSKTPGNLLRCSVGLENADDLIADLSQALA